MSKTFFKKIIPSILITAVLFTGFFGVFRVSPVQAQLGSSGINDPKVKAAKLGNNPAGDPSKKEFIGPRTEEQQKEFDEISSKTGCSAPLFGWDVEKCFKTIMAMIGNQILSIFAFFTRISGFLLDRAVDYTIIDMGDNTKNIGAIEKGWKTIRDLSNIVIIFILLAIGIGMIVRYEPFGSKKLLGKLILVAMLINFSLFFTQVIIDSSNLISLQFYNRIVFEEQDPNGQPIIRNIGEKYMQAFGLTTIYDAEELLQPEKLSGNNSFGEIFLISILGSVVFIVASFAFLAGAFLLISRFVVLVFLMILAPLAFVGMILPALSGTANKWWSALVRYAFFAPAYMILTWFVIEVINSPAYRGSIGLDNGASFAGVVAGGNMAIILNFAVVIAFIIASVLISDYLGIYGSKAVMSYGSMAKKWGQGVVGFGKGVVGRNTIGFGSKYVGKAYDRFQAGAEKTKGGRVTRTLASIASLGALSDRAIKGTLSAGENAKFGSGASYADMDKKYKERRSEVSGIQQEMEQKKAMDIISNSAKFNSLTPNEKRELLSKVGDMTIRDLERPEIKKHLLTSNVAKYLSAEQLEGVLKSKEFTGKDTEKIRGARFSHIIDSSGNVTDESAFKKLSDKETEMLGEKNLYNPNVIKAMAQSQVEIIKKSAKFNSAVKEFVIDANKDHLENLPDDKLISMLQNTKPSLIAKMPASVLKKEAAVRAYSPSVLNAFVKEEMTTGDRADIRKKLDNAYKSALKLSGKKSVTMGDTYDAGGGAIRHITQEMINSHKLLNDKKAPLSTMF